jgi:Alginate export
MKRVRLAQFAVFFLLVASVSVWAQTEAKQETKQETKARCPSPHPSFPSMTYDEDNRYLRNPECRTEFLDRLKYIPLGENENYYLSFGASIRERGEYYSNPNWASRPPGTAYLLQRLYAHADLHLGERLRFFTEFGSSIESGRKGGPRPSIDKDKLDIHQAFADVVVWRSGKNSVRLRTGRQEMAFGDQSFVSTRDGRNVRRSFDGFRATGKFGDWTTDAFAVRQSASKPGFFDDSLDHTTSFWGLYAGRPFRTLPGGHVDLYYMGLDNKKVTYDQGTGREQRETAGARLWGSTEHWDYNQEYTFQWGSFGSDHIRAWAVAAETGYRLDKTLFKPRFAVKSDAYSGDRHRSDRTLNTFNALYERGPYFSYAELFGKRNLMALQPSVQLNLPGRITLTPNAAFYWRESPEDGLYSVATGAIVVSGRKSSARFIGSHVAAQLKWIVDRHTTVFAEYLHFFPGNFLKQSTPGRNTNYATWWLEYRF